MDEAGENPGREERRTLGATLAAERERQGLARADVAQRLHMSPSQVEALETGEYERLPKGPFLRGFVRNYAKLIGLDPDGVLSLLAEGAPREAAPRIIVPTQNIRFDPLGQRFTSPWVRAGATAVVVIALALAAMYWWVFVRPQRAAQHQASVASPAVTMPSPAGSMSPPFAPDTTASGAAPAPSPPPALTPPAATPPASASPPDAAATSAALPATDSKGAESKPLPSVSSKPAEAQPGPATAPAKPVAGARRLHFRFKGESWVEVRDASGHVVFRQLNPAGSEASVDAKPPLQVTVGNAHEVEMQRDGKPFDLAEPANDTDVARFKVE